MIHALYTLKQLIEDYSNHALKLAMEPCVVDKSLDAILTLAFCITRHAGNVRTGTKEFVIGGEVKKLLARTTACNILPLLTKTTMYIRYPLHFLGAPISELWNGSGSKALICNFRDITIGDTDGRTLGCHQRGSLFGAVRALASKCQIGNGLNAGGHGCVQLRRISSVSHCTLL